MTLDETKKLVSEFQFTGALSLFHTSVRSEEKSSKHLRVWLHMDMPTAIPGLDNTCNIENTIDLRWSDVGDCTELTPEYLKNRLYDMLMQFLVHELREGFRLNGEWVIPAHGTNNEFLPHFKEYF